MAPKDRCGQSLIQALIGVAVLSSTAVTFLTMQTMQVKADLNVQAVVSRNMLELALQQNLVSRGAMAQTVLDVADPGNVGFANCLQGAACTAVASQGFYLLDSLGNKIAGAGPASPIYYDYKGASCATPSPQCLFQVYTTYTAVCQGPSPCSIAAVTAQYTIGQAPGISPVGGTPLSPVTSRAIPVAMSGSSPIFVNVYRANPLNTVPCAFLGPGWAPTPLIFDTLVEDLSNLYNTVTGKLVLPVGLWRLTASTYAYAITLGAQHLAMVIYKNGVKLATGPAFRNKDENTGSYISYTVRSNGVDTYDFELDMGNCPAGATVPVAVGQATTWMQAVQLN